MTHAGKPVAELRAIPGQALTAEALLARWATLPAFEAQYLKDDIHQVLDPFL